MTKNFLPRSSVSIPLRDLTDGLIENAPKVIRVPSRIGACAKRVFPLVGVFSLLFGSAFLGFSIVTVDEGYVGYFAPKECAALCEVKSYPPGTYFEMPWKRGEFKRANVMDRNLTLGKLFGETTAHPAKICAIEYSVVNLNSYLVALVTFKSEQALEGALIDEVKRPVVAAIENKTTMVLNYTTYGLFFTKIVYLQ